MSRTSFISLSNQEARDFITANSQLDTLVKEANFLDGNLKEESSRAKEKARTGLGAFHSALALNHELSQSNDREVLENVLKLIHNSAMRIVEFFEHVVQIDPSKKIQEPGKSNDLVIEKTIYDGTVYYCLKQKDGKNITISLNKDAKEDFEYYDSYKIEYSDSLEPYIKIKTEQGKELRSTEESLEFFAQYNANHFILKITKAHNCGQNKDSQQDTSVLVNNLKALLEAKVKAEEKIPLQRLDLHQETDYIQTLITTLEQKLESNQQ